jgi:TRAP-type C4-dicarboxylate transport system substrate-binding protein
VTSPSFYAGLSPQLRNTLEAVKRELDVYIFDYQARLNRERLEKIRQKIRQAGGTEFIHVTEAEREVFRNASLPVRERYLAATGERGRRLLASLLQHSGRASP